MELGTIGDFEQTVVVVFQFFGYFFPEIVQLQSHLLVYSPLHDKKKHSSGNDKHKNYTSRHSDCRVQSAPLHHIIRIFTILHSRLRSYSRNRSRSCWRALGNNDSEKVKSAGEIAPRTV